MDTCMKEIDFEYYTFKEPAVNYSTVKSIQTIISRNLHEE